MTDRISPFLVLLLNDLVTGFVPLFCLALSSDSPLPVLWPVLVALAIWSIPDLVVLARVARSEARLVRLFHAVFASIRRGHVGLVVVLGLLLAARAIIPAVPLAMVGVAAFLSGGFLQGRELRRQVKRLYVLDP